MKKLSLLAIAFLMTVPVWCQTTTFSSVTVGATAVGITGNGTSNPATIISGTLPVSSKINVGTMVLLNSATDTNAYMGQFSYTLPLPKSVDAKKFQCLVIGSVGVDQVSFTNAPTQQHIAGGGFVQLNYDPTGSGHFAFGPMVGYLRLPGSSQPNTAVVALGANISFGK